MFVEEEKGPSTSFFGQIISSYAIEVKVWPFLGELESEISMSKKKN